MVPLNSTTPSAPGGSINITWQTDEFGNISAYVTASGVTGNTPLQEALSGTQNGTNKVFTGSHIVNTTLPYQLFYNGQALVPGAEEDFTVSGNDWTFINIAPISSDTVYAVYWYA